MSLVELSKVAFARSRSRTTELIGRGWKGLGQAGISAGLGALKGGLIGAGMGAAGAVIADGIHGTYDRDNVRGRALQGATYGALGGAAFGLVGDLGRAQSRLMTPDERSAARMQAAQAKAAGRAARQAHIDQINQTGPTRPVNSGPQYWSRTPGPPERSGRTPAWVPQHTGAFSPSTAQTAR
jgi:hypothetical protein